MSLTPKEEVRFQRFLKKRNVTDPEKIEEYRLGLILVREIGGKKDDT